MESRVGVTPEKVSQGQIVLGSCRTKGFWIFTVSVMGRHRGGFKQGIGIRMGFLSKESFQLLCGEKAVEKENGGKESKRLC